MIVAGPARSWLALAGAWIAAALAVTASTQLSLASGLVFHLHPIAIGAGGGWLYRSLNGERPCSTHTAAFLVGIVALLSANASTLRPAGLTDPDWLAAPIALAGLAAAWWILARPEPLARSIASAVPGGTPVARIHAKETDANGG